MKETIEDILVIDHKTAGELPQPFEHAHKFNVVVFHTHVEIRECEQLAMGMQKYAIHTERVPCPVPDVRIDYDLFLKVFKRAYLLQTIDLRQVIKMALKGSTVGNVVV